LDDESKHYKSNIPITKEAVAALRAKQRALDARPIKKVAEAKARKKFKAAQRLEKAMKKAEGVNATSDLSEREKAQQIEKLMRKGMSSGKKVKKDVKVVVAKGAHKGVQGRPKGVKGRYVMLDSRMKKEVMFFSSILSPHTHVGTRCEPRGEKRKPTKNDKISLIYIIWGLIR
jgi:AdoMet-dependent rRNA methyltransferase SPB1